jgi:nucleoid DNA-binding protein
MATLIQAVVQYRPRVAHTRTIELDELAERLARGSLFSKSVARMVLEDLSDEIRYAMRTGAQVRLPGIGLFRTAIRLDGTMRTGVLIDSALRDNLMSVTDFNGQIIRRHNVGLDLAALKLLWDADHPDDPLELPANTASATAAPASNGAT